MPASHKDATGAALLSRVMYGVNSAGVAVPAGADDAGLILQTGRLWVSDGFTRPADTNAYTANDVVANSTTGSAVVPLVFDVSGLPRGNIRQMNVTRGTNAIDMNFRLHLFDTQPFAAGSYPADNSDFYASITKAKMLTGIFPANNSTGAHLLSALGSTNMWQANIPYDATASGFLYGVLLAQSAVAMGNAERIDVALLCSGVA